MNTLLFEPFAGISGDMTVGALLSLGAPFGDLKAALGRLPLSGYSVRREEVRRGSFAGVRFVVEAEEGHVHRALPEVKEILSAGNLPDRALARAMATFEKLAAAEGAAHGIDPDRVHFHEVGAVDSIVDIAGAALGLELLGVDRILTTRIRVGTGEVDCRHGRIPVPAPGTAALLAGFPVLYAKGEGETTTPTGAAILAALAEPAPAELDFTPTSVGYGAGAREDTFLPNLLRATLIGIGGTPERDRVVELQANVDDLTPEALAFAAERLRAAGALDVWVVPVVMKKGRAGAMIDLLARPEDADRLERLIFSETTTFGVRRAERRRSKLTRDSHEVKTPWGTVRVKVGRLLGEVVTRSPEYEDCARVAREAGVAIREVLAAANREAAAVFLA